MGCSLWGVIFFWEIKMATNMIINYTGKYQPSSIVKDIIDSNKNTHLVKDRCGSGATHSILTLHKEKILLLSPTVALVKEKERHCSIGMFGKTDAEFLYGGKDNRVTPILDNTGHLIMGTADQLVKLKAGLFVDAGYTLIIDELHVDIMASLYREPFRNDFIRLVKPFASQNSCITVTATPVDIYPPMMSEFDFINLTTSYIPLTPKAENKTLMLTTHVNKFISHIETCLENKEILVLFTNSEKMIDKVIKFADKTKVKTYIGSKLAIGKLAKYKNLQSNRPLLYICSSAATEGIDITEPDAHVCIHNLSKTNFGFYSVQSIVQALGRTRNGYKDAVMVLDPALSRYHEKIEATDEIVECALLNVISCKDLVNNPIGLEAALKNYNYISVNENISDKHKKYLGTSIELDVMIKNFLLVPEDEFKHLFKIVMSQTRVNNNFFGFDMKIAFGFLITKIIKTLDLPNYAVEEIKTYVSNGHGMKNSISQFRSVLHSLYLINSKFKPNNAKVTPSLPTKTSPKCPTSVKIYKPIRAGFEKERSKRMFKFSKNLSIDWQVIFAEKKQQIESLVTDLETMYFFTYPTKATKAKVKQHISDKKSRYDMYVIIKYLKLNLNKLKSRNRKLNKKLNDKEDIISRQEYDKTQSSIEEIMEYITINEKTRQVVTKDKMPSVVDIEALNAFVFDIIVKNQLRQVAALYARDFISGMINKGFRQYSVITSLGIDILGICAPYGLIEADIKQAYPSFIAAIVGDGRPNIYDVVMKNRNCTKSEAKVLYNKFLNSTMVQISNVNQVEFFRGDCEYTVDQADTIININLKQGEAFKVLSGFEQEVIRDITPGLRNTFKKSLTVRRHDSLVVFCNNKQYDDMNNGTLGLKTIQSTVSSRYKGRQIELNTMIALKFVI